MAAGSASLGSHKILLVEDDVDIRDVVQMAIEAEGYAVVPAANGAEALVHLRNGGPFCLILLDLMMPVMDGWQFRARQTRDPTVAAIPVVVISADTKVPQKATALHAVAYLKKPLDFDDLIATVRRYC